jgi:hypothetical protein
MPLELTKSRQRHSNVSHTVLTVQVVCTRLATPCGMRTTTEQQPCQASTWPVAVLNLTLVSSPVRASHGGSATDDASLTHAVLLSACRGTSRRKSTAPSGNWLKPVHPQPV